MSDQATLPAMTIRGGQAPSDDVTLLIRGMQWGGWTDVRITRGIERLPSDFQVDLTEFAPGQDGIEILRGDTCVVMIGPDVVVTGYVDRVLRSLDARQHRVTILGRSKCADLVDCAAEWKGGQIVGSSVLEIAQLLAQPYGIKVSCIGDPGPKIPQFNLLRGETPFATIERLCRFGQLLAYDQPSGDLLLTAVGKTRAASGFKEGVNVIRAQVLATMDQRFSEYLSYQQSLETLNDIGAGGDLQAVVTDPAVPRHRRRIMISETSGSIGWQIAQQRAGWEAQRRRGRSTEVRITTDSWRDVSGLLYEPNTLALVELPALKVEPVSLIIGEVTYQRGDRGTLCDLLLMPSEAFTPQPFNVLQLLPFVEMAEIAVKVSR
jgi:prophage tail gpP-like protein